ncbi:hypothetical protein JSY14_04980 [Brachybacterium sp. EF45031]|uniref:hypothetical protein n=1 Tax=Brachybacterium sillae TaxID=2810536 RepID=UPI00217D5EDB|nr:hypothetical protein [Brachybacterium sillae]MCS6711406.1 hypothetical protein [Brachybacterium sillae]
MSQGPTGGLPDLSAAGRSGGDAPERDDDAPQRPPRRSLAIVLGVAGTAVVLLAILALVLSQTVFRGVLRDDPLPTAGPSAPGPANPSRSSGGEYIPNPNDPDIAPPPPIFTQAPTAECTVPGGPPGPGRRGDTLTGGGLSYTIPRGWDTEWGFSDASYLTGVSAQARHVEGSWYSVVALGRVEFPQEEGGFPGMEPAAVAIFQCYATSAGVLDMFGENPTITDYRSEPTTVDGRDAWIVQATYHFEERQLSTTSASTVTAMVVDTPGGPSGLASDVAADVPQHATDLEAILGSLRVTG